jgi:ring-1,2-phenylacetyl-CoA epoxidase subunit PaaE
MSFIQLRITAIVQETADTKTFFVEPVEQTTVHYKAGQFITLIFRLKGREVRRSYSLGSSPLADRQLFFTVKRKVNGEISRQLQDHYKAGDLFTALLPSGMFTIEVPEAPVYFFIAAGSGITPVFSLIKELLYRNNDSNIILINQCRDEENIIYKKALSELQKKFANRFELIIFFSRPKSAPFMVQHHNNLLLENIIRQKINNSEKSTVKFYLCGPLSFMRMAEFTTRQMGFLNEQIKKEQFIIEPAPSPPLISDTSSKILVIHYQRKTFKLETGYPVTLLDAGLKYGIPLPYSCKAGICGTCVAKCVKGKIIMSRDEVLTEKELKQGLILTCVGHPVNGDIELEIKTEV